MFAYPKTGGQSTTPLFTLNAPVLSMAVDSLGHVYVADAVFDNIQVFDLSGRLLLNLGQSGSGPGQFCLLNGIAISRDNHIYVADSCNHRVQVFQYVGQP